MAIAADTEANEEDKNRLNTIFGFELEESLVLSQVLDDASETPQPISGEL